MKLNLGCGDDIREGYINIDGDPNNKNADLILDCKDLSNFKKNSVTVIEADHFFEHIYFPEAEKFIAECYRVLKKDGYVELEMPNIKRCCELYLSNEPEARRLALVGFYGFIPDYWNEEGLNTFQTHKFGWDMKNIKRVAHKTGFKEVVEINIRQDHREAARFNRDFRVRIIK